MSAAAAPAGEPPLYRPFALLALGATLIVGAPIGLAMLAWLYWGAPAVPGPWRLLHAHAQIVGWFGTLIAGMAQHLLARFTGQPVRPGPDRLAVVGLLGAGLGLRLADTALAVRGAGCAAALLGALAFAVLGGRVWRALAAPDLAALRRHLTASTGWLALAMLAEAGLSWRALAAGAAAPDLAGMRAVHALALYGGVLGWILGVLLRAGPMFVPGFRVPGALARLAVWMLGVGAWLAAAGEGLAEPVPARLGELVALLTLLATLARGGAFAPTRGALPMLGRSPAEARIFRLALASACAAAAALACALVLAALGRPAPVLTDAARHLVAVGLLTSVAVAMGFRLVAVIEGRALPWPRLRAVAFWALLSGVLLRTAEMPVALGAPGLALLVPLSGAAVWIALACLAANLVGLIARGSRS